jgi:4-hydroxy-tetrahydrodipicolinate synthase
MHFLDSAFSNHHLAFPSMPTPLLRGIIPPLVTPLSGPDSLDVAGLERLVEHVLTGGVNGLFLLGSTGEGAALSDRLRREVVGRVIRQTAGRVPVVVHVTDPCFPESMQLARIAAEAGADAAVVAAPYYLPMEQRELESYVRLALDEQPLPLLLYNIPIAKTCYEPETVLRLSQLDRVVGIKDSSGDLPFLLDLRRRVGRPDWTFLVGAESLLSDAVAAGGNGCVGAGANLHPRLFASLYGAGVRGERDRAAGLRRDLDRLGQIYSLAPGWAAVIRGIKCALAELCICDGRMAPPYRACNESERRAVRQCLADLGLLTAPSDAAAPVPVPPTPVSEP